MKKYFALILCLVFVISIALVTCVAFIPMNVTQVADAEVDRIYGELYYKVSNIALSDLTFKGPTKSGVTSATNFGLPMRMYTSISENRHAVYNYFESDCFSSNNTYTSLRLIWYKQNPNNTNTEYLMYIAGNAVSSYHFDSAGWYTGQYRYANDWDKVYYTKTAVSSSFFDNNDAGLYFVNAPTVFYQSGASWQQHVFHVLEEMLTPRQTYSYAPEFDTNFASFSINYRFIGFGLSPYTSDYIFPDPILYPPGDGGYRDGQYAYQIVGVEITNASYFVGDFTYLGVTFEDCCPIYYKSYYDGGYFDGYSICSLVGETYYLYLALPEGFDNLQLYFAIDSNGDQVMDFTSVVSTYINSASSDPLLITLYNTFHENYRKISESDVFALEYDRGYYIGYAEGQQNEQNNLVDVIWATFMMPIKILFGTFNSSTNSYDGGLFNFSILGLDIRAFVLSVMSVCLIIACIKIVLGLRGGSNG